MKKPLAHPTYANVVSTFCQANSLTAAFGLGSSDFCKPSGAVPAGFTVSASPRLRGIGGGIITIAGDRSTQSLQYAATPNSATFELTFKENRTDLPFSMIAVC
jgi:hypothetical protein